MRVLLDTVTLLFAIESPAKLSRAAKKVFSRASIQRDVSVVSFVEIAVKRAGGKITVSPADIQKGIADLELRVLPLTPEHAMKMFDLPLHHKDPFDRQLIAQAMVEQIPIVTCDAMFELYEGLKVIW